MNIALSTALTAIIAVGGAVAYTHITFATQTQVAAGLDAVIQKAQSDRCTALLLEIQVLEQKESDGTITESQKDRLRLIRNLYDSYCKGA